LAFHPYPQVIGAVFNPHPFGPPLGVTPASPCPWVDRPGFGSTPAYCNALVTGLAFAPAPLETSLALHARSNSPDHNAKGTQSEDTQGEPHGLLLPLVGMWFQALFHSPPRGAFHLSLTVLVHYRSHGSRLALEGGPPSFTPGSSDPGATQELHHERPLAVAYRALTVSDAPFQGTSAGFVVRSCGSYNPGAPKDPGLGSTRFARRYYGSLG
jgi:hypothetical protein